MACKTCGTATPPSINDECPECFAISQAAWQKKMAIRQDPGQFNLDQLIRVLLTQHWMHECKIIPDYMPPYPRPETRPTCQVCYPYEDGTASWLRYSAGPLQGYFWDLYGGNMYTPELALLAISQAPAPPRVNVVPTHGR